MKGGILITLTTAAVFALLVIAMSVPALAGPSLGVTPTPTPGGPPPPGPVVIPEPATLALLGAGVAGLLGYARRRK